MASGTGSAFFNHIMGQIGILVLACILATLALWALYYTVKVTRKNRLAAPYLSLARQVRNQGVSLTCGGLTLILALLSYSLFSKLLPALPMW